MSSKSLRAGVLVLTLATMMLCMSLSAAAMDWEPAVVDDGPDTGEFPSIAIDHQGRVHVSYVGEDNTLKYARLSGSSWTIETVDGNVSGYTSLAIDSMGYPHISYINTYNNLRYAKKFGGVWTLEGVDAAHRFDYFTSIALDSNDMVHITYQDYFNGIVRHAERRMSHWDTDVVSDLGSPYRSVLAIDGVNTLHVAYYDSQNGVIRHSTQQYGSDNWYRSTVMSGTISEGELGMDIDSNNRAHIVADLQYARYNGTAWVTETLTSPMTGSISWVAVKVDSEDRTHVAFIQSGALGFAVRQNGTWSVERVQTGVMDCPSITVNDNDEPYIAYYVADTMDLNYTKGTYVADPDSDHDSLLDSWEISNFGNLTYDGDDDPDGDGYDNHEEYLSGTDPMDETDFPAAPSDGDALPDTWEMANFGTLDYDEDDDPDGDGYSNLVEYYNDTDPMDASDYPGAEEGGESNAGLYLAIIVVIVVVAVVGLLMFLRMKKKPAAEERPPEPGPVNICPTCGQPAEYVPEQAKHWCQNCGKYIE